jgi:hypothetical protein
LRACRPEGTIQVSIPNRTPAYRFTFGELSIVWHDTVGPLSVAGEGGAEAIRTALTGLGPVDIEIGAIQDFKQISNGLKDARIYIESVHAKVFMPAHHDNWLPPNVTTGNAYYEPLVDELALIQSSDQPDLCFITDPGNYSTVFTFTTAEWAGALRGSIQGCWTPE